MANKQEETETPMEEQQDLDAPSTSGSMPSTSKPTMVPGQAMTEQDMTRSSWLYEEEVDGAIQEALPDRKPEEKQCLSFVKSDVIDWIKRTTPGELVPCTIAAPMIDREWETSTRGWTIKKFRANIEGQPTGGYDTVATSKDKQRVLIRCDGPITIETLDWLITAEVVPTFAKVHYITEEEIEKRRSKGEEVPDVCVEIDPTKENIWRHQTPKTKKIKLSPEAEAKILAQKLMVAYTIKPELIPGATQQEQPQEKEQDQSKKTQEKQKKVYARILTNVVWGFCKSTYDLTWKTERIKGRYLMTQLQTTQPGQKVYIIQELPEKNPAEDQEPEVAQPTANESSDEEMLDLEDEADRKRNNEAYTEFKKWQDAMGIEGKDKQTKKLYWTPNVSDYTDFPWPYIGSDADHIASYCHWQRHLLSTEAAKGTAGASQNQKKKNEKKRGRKKKK